MKDVDFNQAHIPGIIRKNVALPEDSAARKGTPIFSGGLMYFPDAFAALARLSRIGNDKHNKGQPLHWSREKSNDHADCVARHLIDAGPDWTGTYVENGEEVLHAVAAFWRAGAMAQIAIERLRERKAAAGRQTPEAPVENGWKWVGTKKEG